ncbi:MAG: hypothetical protein JSV91_06825 [Phycisphaerales bacterium]|nr:MAG: hypothetical protein JSV91_06825 [Phycisphaerales bacterium]
MFKFLRKYNKWILAVGGTLLMITFLIPGAIQRLSQSIGRGSALIATMGPNGEEELKAGAWEQIKSEVQLIVRLRAMNIPGITGTLAGAVESPQHWYLLVREAEQAGLIGGDALFRSYKWAQNEGRIPQLGGYPDRFVLETMRRIEGVNRLSLLYIRADKHSDRRLRNVARRKLHSVQAQLVVIEASQIPGAAEPSEERLVEQLDAYGDIAPGEGDMGFGYKLPDRVKIEWLGIDVDPVMEMLRQSEQMDDVKLREHWVEHENNEELGFPPVDDAGEVPEVVAEHLLEKVTRETMDAIAKYASNELRRPRRPLPTMDDGYLGLPEDWPQRRVSLPKLAEMIQERYGIPAPRYQAPGEQWLAVEELTTANIGDIAEANTKSFGRTPTRLMDLVQAAKEFGGSTAMTIQQGVADPVLRRYDTQEEATDLRPMPVYVFRIIDTDPSRPPESVDEVREDLVRDVQRYDHYQQLLESIPQIENQAREEGMLALAVAHDTVIQRETEVSLCQRNIMNWFMTQGQPIQMYATPLPGLGDHKETITTIVNRALDLPQELPIETLDPEHRIFALPVEDSLAVVVVRLTRQDPLPEETYDQLASTGQIQQLALSEDLEQGQVLRDAFSFQTLAERHSFEFARAGDMPLPEEEMPDETATEGKTASTE